MSHFVDSINIAKIELVKQVVSDLWRLSFEVMSTQTSHFVISNADIKKELL